MKFWKKLSNFGVDNKMTNLDQRRVILTNQISSVVAVIIFIITLLLVIKVQLYINAFFAFLLFIALLLIPLLNKKGFTNASKLIISIMIPITVVAASTLGKINPGVGRDIVFYFAPRVFIIASLVVPLLLIDYRNKKSFIATLAVYFILLATYSKINTIIGISIENANLSQKTYFFATTISIFAFIVLTVSFIFLQKLSIKYEESLENSNKLLGEQKEKILIAYEELQATEEELRQNTEELYAVNENMQEANVLIKEKNISLEQKNTEIEEKSLLIESSIRYAKDIQRAILPSFEDINRAFNNFSIYRPRDIVSGDFIWHFYCKRENSNYIATADCTGHGIPGAFLSIISSRLLHKIIVEHKINRTKEILTVLNDEIIAALKQSDTKNIDGLDISLCAVFKTPEGVKIEFSGAKLPVYYYKKTDKKIVRIKGDSKHIGGIIVKKDIKREFTTKEILLQNDDMLYLATDGYIDQNNEARKRFGTPRFVETLTEIAEKTLAEQKEILETKLDNWQNNTEQRDDITLIGIKI